MRLDKVLFSLSGQEVTLGQLVLIPTVLVLGYLVINWLANLISSRLKAGKLEPDVIHLVRRIFYILAFAVLAITTLDMLNVPLTAFAFVSGAVAIGVGFGAQNIINNFISGWILMWERPIRIGDFLEIGEGTGTVESIDTRSTRIRRVDGVHMLVPNSALLENTVVNWNLIDNLIRNKIRVGVAYGSPVKQVAELILQATSEHEATLSQPPLKVIFEDFGDSALIFDTYFWVNADSERDLRAVRSDIRFRIVELFEANSIVIAYPQRDMHIDGTVTLLADGHRSPPN
ncbi:MAG: small-conductance mechanosensitive channel [Gammaproteobacteria bacterium]|jgi:small-conductance mechanosensitive channel